MHEQINTFTEELVETFGFEFYDEIQNIIQNLNKEFNNPKEDDDKTISDNIDYSYQDLLKKQFENLPKLDYNYINDEDLNDKDFETKYAYFSTKYSIIELNDYMIKNNISSKLQKRIKKLRRAIQLRKYSANTRMGKSSVKTHKKY
jgi:hypothetical protein